MDKVFIATALANRSAAFAVRKDLQDLRYEVTSTWIDREPVADPQNDERASYNDSAENFGDICRSQIVLILTVPGQGTGHHVETGFAFAMVKKVVVVGPITSIFQHLTDNKFTDWPSARAWFEKRRSA